MVFVSSFRPMWAALFFGSPVPPAPFIGIGVYFSLAYIFRLW